MGGKTIYSPGVVLSHDAMNDYVLEWRLTLTAGSSKRLVALLLALLKQLFPFKEGPKCTNPCIVQWSIKISLCT